MFQVARWWKKNRRQAARRIRNARLKRRSALEPLEPRRVLTLSAGSGEAFATPLFTPLKMEAPGALFNDSSTRGAVTVHSHHWHVEPGGPPSARPYTLNSDGSFSYHPDKTWKPANVAYGATQWHSLGTVKYRVTDGVEVSDWITLGLGTITPTVEIEPIQVIVCATCGCPCDGVVTRVNPADGSVQHKTLPDRGEYVGSRVTLPGRPGDSDGARMVPLGTNLAYNSSAASGKERVVFDRDLPFTADDEIEAHVTLDSTHQGYFALSPASYDNSKSQRINFELDLAGKPTDVYEAHVNFRSRDNLTGSQQTDPLVVYVTHVSRNDAGSGNYVGRGWMIEGYERLIKVDADWEGTDEVRDDLVWVRGDGNSFVFLQQGGSPFYTHAPGDTDYNVLTKINDTTFELVNKFGTKRRFESGNLVWVDDRNGNRTTVAWGGGGPTSITLPGGRTTAYAYTGGKVTSITDPAGRVTVLGYTGENLTSITRPDPDGAGPLAAPVLSFVYDLEGQLTSFTNPDGKTHTYSYVNRQIVSHGLPNGASETFSPTHADGNWQLPLLTPPVKNFYETEDVDGTYTDTLGRSWTIYTGAFGFNTKTIGPDGTILYARNSDGQVTQITYPDPDGAGPEAAPVAAFGYTTGSLSSESLPGGVSRAWSYGTKGQVSSFTDERGLATTYTLNAQGDVTQASHNVGGVTSTWTFTHTTTDVKGLFASVTDPLGTLTTFAYNGYGLAATIVEASGTGLAGTTTIAYTSSGMVASVTDPLGQSTSFVYDTLDRLLSTTLPDPDGAGPLLAPIYVNQLDILGRRKKAIDPLGRETEWFYDTVHNVTEERRPDHDANGQLTVTTFAWDYGYRNTSVTDPRGNTTTFQYSTLDDLVQATLPDPDGAGSLVAPIWMWSHDILSRNTNQVDALGNTITYAYQNFWRTVTATLPDPDGTGPGTTSTVITAMNPAGDVTSVTDELGRVTTYTRDTRGLVLTLSLNDPPGAQTGQNTGATYDKLGQIVTSTDPLGAVTEYFRDARHRVIEVRAPDPDGAGPLGRPSVFYAYDLGDRIVSITDPRGNITSIEYDRMGRVKKVLEPDPDGAGPMVRPETQYVYNAASELTSTINALGHVTAFEYDALGNHIKTILPDPDGAGPLASPQWVMAYDANGNMISERDPLLALTQFQFDNLDRNTRITQPDSAYTQFSFDAMNNLTALVDPVGNSTVWQYDTRYRVINETNALNKTRTYKHDAVGNVIERTDRNGKVVQWIHDHLNQATTEIWVGAGGRTFTFDRDALSRITKATDGSNTNRYWFDTGGNVSQETVEIAGLSGNAFERTFDITGNVLTVAARVGVTISSGGAISGGAYDYKNTLAYDVYGLVSQIKQESNGGNAVAEKRVDFGYNALHDLLDVDRYANLTGTQLVAHTDLGYDNLRRLTSIDHLKGATTFAAYDQFFDAASRITAVDEVFSDSAWNEEHDYLYDNTNQLTSANHSVQSDEAYDLDANGNRDGNQTHLGATHSSTVIANNRILSDGTFNYGYDDEGNLISKVRISNGERVDYTWDHRQRLIKATFKDASGTITNVIDYDYDFLNRMISRKETPHTAGVAGTATTDFFVHDGVQIVLQFQKVGTGAAALTDRVLWGPQVDQLLVVEKVTSTSSPGTNHWALTNHLGNVIDVATYNSGTDTTTIVKHRRIDSFGNITFDSAPGVIIAFAFTGKYRDEDTGFSQHWRRWLVTTLGVWANQDPSGLGPDVNARRYAGNDPANATDPMGLEKKKLTPDEQAGILERAGSQLAELVAAGKMTEEERELRLEIIKAAMSHKMQFSSTDPPDPDYYYEHEGEYKFKAGVVIKGLHARVYREGVNGRGSNTGCTRAAQVIALEALAQIAIRRNKEAEFDSRAANRTVPSLFGPSWYKKESNEDGFNPDTLIPGDRVRMRNHRHSEADGEGYEGSNVFYLGTNEDGEHLFVHMDSPFVETLSELRETVREYTPDPSRRDPDINNYIFTERYTYSCPPFLKNP